MEERKLTMMSFNQLHNRHQQSNLIQTLNQQGIDNLFLLDFTAASRNFVQAVREINDLQRLSPQVLVEDRRNVEGHAAALLERTEQEQLLREQQELEVIDLETSTCILGDRESLDEGQNTSPIWLYDKTFHLFTRMRHPGCEQEQQDRPEDQSPNHEGTRVDEVQQQRTRRVEPFSDSNAAQISAAVLYNTGLSHHLRGLVNSNNTRIRDFRRCIQLYQIALNLLTIVDPENIDSCRVLVLAIYNNMAHIYLHFRNVSSYRICIDFLRQVLLTGRPSLEDAFFEVNIFLADKHPSPNASAA